MRNNKRLRYKNKKLNRARKYSTKKARLSYWTVFFGKIEFYIILFVPLFTLYSIFWFFSDDSPPSRYISTRNYYYPYTKTVYFKAKIIEADKVVSSPEFGKSQYRYTITWHGWDPEYKRYNDIHCTIFTSKEKAYKVGDTLAFLDYEEDDARDCRIPTQNPEKVYLYLKWSVSKLFD